MTVGVYVAGASKQVKRVQWAYEKVRADPSMRLTRDWLAQIAGEPIADKDLSREIARDYALGDLHGVKEAQVIWLLAPHLITTIGAWVELGYAIALQQLGESKPLIVASGGYTQSIFCACADREFALDTHAFSFIADWVRSSHGPKEQDRS